MKMRKFIRRWFYIASIGILGITAVTGCGKKSDSVAVSSEKGSVSAPAVGNQDVMQKFLTELEAQPVEKRKSYVESHQSEAAMVAQSKDPQVSEKFYALMMPKMAMPQQP